MQGEEYRKLAMRTCSIPEEAPKDRMIHGVCGLLAEIMETEDAAALFIEDERVVVPSGSILEEHRDHTIRELGDVMWMVAEIASATTLDLEYIFDIADDACEILRSQHSLDVRPKRLFYDLRKKASKIAGALQKTYQGHEINHIDLTALLTRVVICVSMLAECFGSSRDEVCEINIKKLRARYPDGFSAEKSLHRAEGDV